MTSQTRIFSLSKPSLVTLIPTALVAGYFISMQLFGGGNKLPVKGRLVLITGGSQGMGLEVAKQLARKGANVAIVARNVEKLKNAMGHIEAEAADPEKQKFKWFSADLTDSKAVQSIFEKIVEWGGVPDIVWTCTGGAHPALLTEATVEILDSQMKSNYMSALYTAHAALQHMTTSPLPQDSPRRHIIFTASVLSFIPVAGYATYSPAKAALRSLSDHLRQECLLYDIDVHCCFPATIFSPGFEFEQSVKPALTKKLEEGDPGQTPEEVARVCISKLEKGHTLVSTSFVGSVLRATAWGGSKRNNVVVDTLWIWVVSLVWLFVGWDMDRTVKKWAKENRARGST